jgi:hypothetical protein
MRVIRFDGTAAIARAGEKQGVRMCCPGRRVSWRFARKTLCRG